MKKEKQNLEQNIEELEKKISELTSGWQRTQADFINFKNKTASDRIELIKFANTDLISQILSVLDNFHLATQHMPGDLSRNNWAVGIKHIEKQLESILKKEGLEVIKTEGEHFNPALHESVEEIKSKKPDGLILEEVAPGYLFGGSVLRAAKVKISKNKKND
ncbi:MAG: nucleotide exchange factor GrpE [Patescibacteria group bacterium]